MIPAIWTAMYIEDPLPDALRRLHQSGWSAFEISTEHLAQIERGQNPEAEIERVCQCLEDLKLSAPQAHAHLLANVADPDEEKRSEDLRRLFCHCEIAVQLGVKNIVMHPGGRGGPPAEGGREEVLRLNVEAFRRLGDYVGEKGCRIALENMNFPGATTPSELLELLAAIGNPAVGIALDTSHANVAGLDLPAAIRTLGTRLIATHISDNDGSGDQHRIPGWGSIDWPAAMKALRDIGYQGLFNMEIPGERHPIPEMRDMKARVACVVAEGLIDLASA